MAEALLLLLNRQCPRLLFFFFFKLSHLASASDRNSRENGTELHNKPHGLWQRRVKREHKHPLLTPAAPFVLFLPAQQPSRYIERAGPTALNSIPASSSHGEGEPRAGGRGPQPGWRPGLWASPSLPCRSPSTRTGASRAATMSAAATTPTCSLTWAAAIRCVWTAVAGWSTSSPTTWAPSTSCGAATTPTTSSGWASATQSAPAASSPTWVHFRSRSGPCGLRRDSFRQRFNIWSSDHSE